MTTYRRVLPDALVAGAIGAVAIGVGVLVVKSPLLVIAAAGLTTLIVAGAVDATFPTLAWLAIAPFVQAIEPGSPLLVFTIAFHRALLPIAALGALLGEGVRGRVRLARSEKVLLVFVAYATVSLIMSWRGSLSSIPGSEATRTLLLSYVVPFGAFVLGRRVPRRSHRKVLGMLALVSAVISAGGVLQSITGLAVFPGAGVWQEIWAPRAVGALGNPAVSAYVAQVGTFIAIYLGFRRPGMRLFAAPAVLAGVAFTILTYTRSAWVALAVGVVAIAWLYRRARPWVIVFVTVTVVAFSLNVGGLVDRAFLEERAGNQENVEGRLAFGSTGFRMFKDEPLLGQGFGRYDLASREFASGFGGVGAAVAVYDTSHNTFLTILAELGAIGFLLYGAAVFYGLRGAVRALRRRGAEVDRLELVSLLAAVLAYLVAANLIDMRFFSFAVSLFWFTVGFLDSSVSAPREPERA